MSLTGIRAGVALSTESDTRAAAREASVRALERAGGGQAAWALCFFSAHHLQGASALREEVLGQTGCPALAGCSAAGVIGQGREVEDGPAVAVMVGAGEGLRATAAVYSGQPGGVGRVPLPPAAGEDGPLLLVLPDAYGVDAAALVAALATARPGLPLFGAGATDDGRAGVSLQIGAEGVVSHSAALLALAGDYQVAVGITQSCTPLGAPRFVTEADGNVVLSLDGRPALEAYLELGANLGLEEPAALAREVLFGFPLDVERPRFSGETCLVRGLAGVDAERRGLVVPFALRPQTAMAFMQRNPLRAEEDMTRMTDELAAKLSGPPELGIYFNCAARGTGLYGRPGVDAGIIRRRFGDFPLIGMFGGFEVGTALGLPNVYTYTGVLVLLRARPGAA